MTWLCCPGCKGKRTHVIDSRWTGAGMRRRHECLARKCSIRFTTFEEFSHVKQSRGTRRTSFKQAAKDQVMAAIERALKRIKP